MKLILTILCIFGFVGSSCAQNTNSDKKYTNEHFAYILIEGRFLSKKLKVNVDLGDTPEQLAIGKQFSEKLTNKKSYAAVLNYMTDNGYSLVETLDYNQTYSGTGGTSGIVFIMKRRD